MTHFGFALDLSDIDLWNIDLLDTHLDLLDADITGKNFACFRDVLKTSSRYDFKTCLEDVFSVTIFRLPRCLQDVLWEVLKTSSRLFKTSWKRFQDLLEDVKLLRWRRVEDVLNTNKCLLGHVFMLRIKVRYLSLPLHHLARQNTCELLLLLIS